MSFRYLLKILSSALCYLRNKINLNAYIYVVININVKKII